MENLVTTVTLNTAFDVNLICKKFNLTGMTRPQKVIYSASGKGVDVSKILSVLGIKNVALGFMAGKNGEFIKEDLIKKGAITDFVQVKGETRYVYNIIDKTNLTHSTIANFGYKVNKEDFSKFKNKFLKWLKKSKVIVLAGSVPERLGDGVFAELLDECRKYKVYTFLDVSGKYLKKTIKFSPYLIKPNLQEAGEFFQAEIKSFKEKINILNEFKSLGAKNVILSLGKEGILALIEDKKYYLVPPKIIPLDPSGAGDGIVAGFIAAFLKGKNIEETLKFSVACSLAVCMTYGTAEIKKNYIKIFFDKLKVKKI